MRQLTIIKQITNRESLSLEKYLAEVSRFKLITIDEEVALARKIRDGDRKALDVLVNANLRFVVSVAKHYQNYGMTLPDLISEGNLGLIRAAGLFDETRGFRFISYAVWWIRQSILKALTEHSRIVRIPFNLVGNYSQTIKAFTKLEQAFQREPTPGEISEMIDLHPDLVDNVLNSTTFHVSMDAPLKEDESNENNLYDVLLINDTPRPDHTLIENSMKSDLARALRTLSSRESEVLKLHFGLNGIEVHSLKEIGIKLNISFERVRQLKNNAFIKLHYMHRKNLLKSHVA
jgi:RNA polymerase primary sigma factor